MKRCHGVLLALLLASSGRAFAGEASPAATPEPAVADQLASATAAPATALPLRALGHQRGLADGENPSTSGYSVLGFTSGCLLGPVGLVCSPFIAGAEPSVPNLAPETPLEYVDGYRDGYRERLRERREAATRRTARIGTVLLTSFAYMVTVMSCNDDDARSDHSGCAVVPGTKQFGTGLD